jgi:hypothetical protein
MSSKKVMDWVSLF